MNLKVALSALFLAALVESFTGRASMFMAMVAMVLFTFAGIAAIVGSKSAAERLLSWWLAILALALVLPVLGYGLRSPVGMTLFILLSVVALLGTMLRLVVVQVARRSQGRDRSRPPVRQRGRISKAEVRQGPQHNGVRAPDRERDDLGLLGPEKGR